MPPGDFPKGLFQMRPRSIANLLFVKRPHASDPLHHPPDILLHVQLPHIVQFIPFLGRKHAFSITHMGIYSTPIVDNGTLENHSLSFQSLLRRKSRCIFDALAAQHPARAEFDSIAVKEERAEFLTMCRVGLHHRRGRELAKRHAVAGAGAVVVFLGLRMVRN